MDIPNHPELLAKIEAFCLRHDMAETRFGREAVSNPNFISGLRRDPPVSPTLKTLNEVQDFMARIDEAALVRAKLDAPPPPLPPSDEEAAQLPFVKAPVNPTGASLPTSSQTSARPQQSAASGSCPTSSCSADSPLVAGPSTPTVAGGESGTFAGVKDAA